MQPRQSVDAASREGLDGLKLVEGLGPVKEDQNQLCKSQNKSRRTRSSHGSVEEPGPVHAGLSGTGSVNKTAGYSVHDIAPRILTDTIVLAII
jgi:hypothetical protein